jgi:hypothetical protein
MSGAGRLDQRRASRRRAELISGLRRLGGQRTPSPANGGGPQPERCDLCGTDLLPDHRHLLHLTERRILCVCESCLALRAGDAELRPTGTRVLWLDDFDLSGERWAAFSIPIGLAFFLRSSTAGGVVAFYPSPAGATECELDLDAWDELTAANPVLEELEADSEALIVDRISDPPNHVIAPIDECYRMVGLIKSSWEGISGGPGPSQVTETFFADLRARGDTG